MDWYRLKSEADVLSLGWEEIMSEPHAAIFVEWADKFPKLLPNDRVEIHFEHTARPDRRKISMRRVGRKGKRK